mmetsp:Transcript_27192/g.65993  ORF Transcript_27192/g.65993 Transcript_27192/m.65993 type:complete len:107 (-) Transcript_27192:229-549(-)
MYVTLHRRPRRTRPQVEVSTDPHECVMPLVVTSYKGRIKFDLFLLLLLDVVSDATLIENLYQESWFPQYCSSFEMAIVAPVSFALCDLESESRLVGLPSQIPALQR